MAQLDIRSDATAGLYTLEDLDLSIEERSPREGESKVERFRNVIRCVVSREMKGITSLEIRETSVISERPDLYVSFNGTGQYRLTPPNEFGHWQIMGHQISAVGEKGSEIYRETYNLVAKEIEWHVSEWDW